MKSSQQTSSSWRAGVLSETGAPRSLEVLSAPRRPVSQSFRAPGDTNLPPLLLTYRTAQRLRELALVLVVLTRGRLGYDRYRQEEPYLTTAPMRG